MEKNKSKIINENTSLLVIAGPMAIELFMNIFLNNIDTLMLSHYSENAVGAVGNANQVMFLLIIMFNIIATATSVVVAQYLGAEKKDKMNQIYTLALFFNLIFGLVLCGILVIGKGAIMNLLNVSLEMRPDFATYIDIVGGFMFIQAMNGVMLQILRCNGYTKIGMYLSFIINIVNIIGNYLFLYGPLKFLNFGVAGVAISTVTARTIALIVAIIAFYVNKVGKISLKELVPFPVAMLSQMIKIGLPSAGENLCYNMYQMVLLSFVNKMGNNAVNAQVYAKSLISFSTVFLNACAMGTQIIIGHLVGAGKEEAAYKRLLKTLRTSLAFTVMISSLNWILSPFSLKLFTSNPDIIKIATGILFVDIFVEFGRCMNITIISSLKAAGDYIFPLIVGICTMWGIGATLGYTMGTVMGLGVAGVFIGTASDECLRGFIVLYRWCKKKWFGKAIVKK